MISSGLAKYEAWLIGCKATVSRFLQKGLSPNEIALQAPKGFPKFDAIAPFYQWHDGIVVDSEVAIGQTNLLPGWVFMPLGEARETWKTGVEEGLWGESCFPLFASDAGDYLLWNSRDEHMYCFLRDEPEVLPIYDTLTSMMSTIDRYVEERVFFVNDAGMVDCVWEREASIARQLNPAATFWLTKPIESKPDGE